MRHKNIVWSELELFL